jgi:hypothetical protein
MMQMMQRIDFAVIGAQKCATSWLYYCLRDHPEIVLAQKKEEVNYFGGPRYLEHGPEWFDRLYSPKAGARIRGSVSVNYLHDAAALRSFCAHFPEARLVVSLRDPIERAVSACEFLMRRAELPLRQVSELVAKALDDVDARRETPESELVTRSLYGRQLRIVEEAGALDRIMFVSFEALARDRLGAIAAIYTFLSVGDPSFVPASLSTQPKRSTHIDALTRIERLVPGSRILGKLMDLSHRGLSKVGLVSSPKTLSEDVLVRFRSLLAVDMVPLRACLERIPPARRWSGPELETLWGLEREAKRDSTRRSMRTR